MPVSGGAAGKLFTPFWINDGEYSGLSWSSDGDTVAYPDRPRPGESSAIHLYSRSQASSRRLTNPPKGWNGDVTPVFAPDGKSLAFVRGPGNSDRDLYVTSVSGGEPRRLTAHHRPIRGLAWTSDGREIVFSSNQSGEFGLWLVAARGGEPKPLKAGRESAFGPTIRHNRLAYARGVSGSNIFRISIRDRHTAATRILASSCSESGPQVSPDGTKVAFQSLRSGTPEIWICGIDGANPRQLTWCGDTRTGSARWSPDGRWIAFESWHEGRSRVFVVNALGGEPKALTGGEGRDNTPSWSHDGKWIYFGSRPHGTWEIWRVPTEGGTPQQMTAHGGAVGMEAPASAKE